MHAVGSAGSAGQRVGHEERMDKRRVADAEVLKHGLEVAHECGAAPPAPSPVLPVRAPSRREVDRVLVLYLVDVDRAVGSFARVGGHVGLYFEV